MKFIEQITDGLEKATILLSIASMFVGGAAWVIGVCANGIIETNTFRLRPKTGRLRVILKNAHS
ncbi:hypothetical protein BZZ01_04565 [Nostocales cyanobacterium HT-58-2]|nr:hypothetical protein BZZ01_04565 [Nostocales cyanobacterium HT-58-2]